MDPHPIFFNHLVLESVFVHLDQESLKTSRLVNRLWEQVARPLLTSSTTFIINDTGRLRELSLGEEECRLIPRHLKVSEVNLGEDELGWLDLLWRGWGLVTLQLDISPPLLLQLVSCLLASGLLSTLQSLNLRVLKFFPSSSSSLEKKELFLADWEVWGGGQGHSALTSFSYLYYSFDGVEDTCPPFWIHLLSYSPALKELRLTAVSKIELDQVLLFLSNSRRALKHLEIISGGSLENEHLQQLVQLDWSGTLESLSLEIGSRIKEIELESVLQHYSSSLLHLQLRLTLSTHSFEFPSSIFPWMGLRCLDIPDGLLPSLDFLHYLPLLEDLRLRNRNPTKLVDSQMLEETQSLCPHLSLKSLLLEENVGEGCVRRIGWLFPSLSHLHIRVDDEMLRLIFEFIPTLRSLTILGKVCDGRSCSDKGVTGIPRRYMEWGARGVSRHRCFPFIGDMQELERVRIESWGEYGGGISDLSIFYGLLQVKQLKEVHLVRTLVSRDGVDALEANGIITTLSSS